MKAWDETGTGQIMVECVGSEMIENYGVADLDGAENGPFDSVPLKGLVEKPSPKDAPSNWLCWADMYCPLGCLSFLRVRLPAWVARFS